MKLRTWYFALLHLIIFFTFTGCCQETPKAPEVPEIQASLRLADGTTFPGRFVFEGTTRVLKYLGNQDSVGTTDLILTIASQTNIGSSTQLTSPIDSQQIIIWELPNGQFVRGQIANLDTLPTGTNAISSIIGTTERILTLNGPVQYTTEATPGSTVILGRYNKLHSNRLGLMYDNDNRVTVASRPPFVYVGRPGKGEVPLILIDASHDQRTPTVSDLE